MNTVDDLRKMLHSMVDRVYLEDDYKVVFNYKVGMTDVTPIGSLFRKWECNETATITITINGGAQDRDQS